MEHQTYSSRVAVAALCGLIAIPGGHDALLRVLLRNQGALLRELLDAASNGQTGGSPEALSEALHADGFQLLRRLVRNAGDGALSAIVDENPDALGGLLEAYGFARLRSELPRISGNTAFNALLFDDDFALFRRAALASNGRALSTILFEDDYRVLREILAARAFEALKAAVFHGDARAFSTIVRTREGRPLADLLFENGAALLRDVCRLRGDGALVPLLEAEGRRHVRAFPQPLKDQLTSDLLREGAAPGAEVLNQCPALIAQALSTPRAEAMAALLEKFRALRPVLPAGDPALESRRRDAILAIDSADHVRGRVLDTITDGDTVRLAGGTMRFPDRHALWTQINEILLNEDYYFPCDTSMPRIIDGGAHMGMAIYYFKTLYPDARITAFEPVPELRALAGENVDRNGWRDVEILPFALSPDRGTATFHRSRAWSMAGSLSPHRAALGEELESFEVDCVPLSLYLREPVDFLKLDIEGAEDAVLEEAAPWLHNVRYLFCEVHQNAGLASGRLANILGMLETAGFDVQVGKSHNFQETSRTRPLLHFEGPASMVIWGRRVGSSKN